jgi:hypothetical protein
MSQNELLEGLISVLEQYEDKISVQEALDGVRDFVCSLLVTEDIDADSFCAAIQERMPEIVAIADRLRNQEAQ